MDGEGWLVEARGPLRGSVVAIPDADETPDRLADLAARFAAAGFRVLVPALIDLGIPGRTTIEFFDCPHRIHGMGSFEFLERHLRGK